jgi:YggT family protein
MHPVSALTFSLLELAELVLGLYMWLLIASAVLSWLIAFNIVNTGNRFVHAVGDFLYRITEPALRPIRRVVPPMGGLDLSPLILILIIWFLRVFLFRLVVLG